jgi:hypothetical protein
VFPFAYYETTRLSAVQFSGHYCVILSRVGCHPYFSFDFAHI